MEPEVEGSPLDSGPEAGTSNILKSLWFPPSTIPTQKSGQIVYGCASLVGEQWDFSLVIFWNWKDGPVVCILSVEDLGDIMAPPDVGSLGRGVTRGPDIFVFWSPACSPPPWPLQFSCWPSWAWSWPSGPARCSLETPCSQQWLCCCCCSSLGSRSSSGGSPRTPLLFTSR